METSPSTFFDFMTSIHTLAMGSDGLRGHAEKPPCCAASSRGHCNGHCPRIEDVLYSQRKGKTNKGAQRWRCKACGTKWTSKEITHPSSMVPDTSSIAYGMGPEEISLDLATRTARPFKKSKIGDVPGNSPNSQFLPSLFSSSPNDSPISSPPSPPCMSVPNSRHNSMNNYVPIQNLSNQSSSNNLRMSVSNNSGIINNNNQQRVSTPNSGPLMGTPNRMASSTPNMNHLLSSSIGGTPPPLTTSSSLSSLGGGPGPTKPVVVSSSSASSNNMPPLPTRPSMNQLSMAAAATYNNNINNNHNSPNSNNNTPTSSGRSSSHAHLPSTLTSSISQQNLGSSLRHSQSHNNHNQHIIQQHQQLNQARSSHGSKISQIIDTYATDSSFENESFTLGTNAQFGAGSQFANNAQFAQFIPSLSMVDCFKRLLHSISVFSRELTPDNRQRLAQYLTALSSPSAESSFNTTPLSRRLLSTIDGPLFNISKAYQSLYQLMAHHHNMMDDTLVSLTRISFDEREVQVIVAQLHKYQPLLDTYEGVFNDLQVFREMLVSRVEALEGSFSDPSLLASLAGESDDGWESPPIPSDPERTLDSMGPLESTLTSIETRLRATQRELGVTHKLQNMLELLYSIHMQSWKAIIEKHQRMVQAYIVDVIQQTLTNADKMSFAYSVLRSMSAGSRRRGDPDFETEWIDPSNPYAPRLNDLLNKYDTIRQPSPSRRFQSLGRERQVLAVYHTQCIEHGVPDDHPESPKRLASVIRAINEFSKQSDRLIIKNDPEEVADKWILTAHSPEYLRHLDEMSQRLEGNEVRPLNAKDGATQSGGGCIQSADGEDGDTFISKHSLRAARRAAGATLHAVDQVVQGAVTSAFVAARPPGHHAGREGLTSGTTSQGFCLINNVAIGAKYAQLKYGVEKIAIVDFDVHHGNGTEEILAGDPGFLFLSIHMFEEGFYPGSGGGDGANGVVLPDGSVPPEQSAQDPNMGQAASNIVNIPLDPKSSALSFLKAFNIIIDRLNEYQPELLMISCGFDAHIDDHLASLCLLDENYVEITRHLRQVADRWCRGRLISVLEGGYNITALRQCTIAHLTALTEDD
ncbi:hypothetical protein SAMD00019534_037020 [Acytostelium subglobosum LB1]|uniref:hypothetical protein n=1 Tax=Acytostelium subglobosum LB1 TaxID=1410327 RepID=UPI0006448A46|nr:hypothetical protein SAMD00019534_037020 [Acytostelium subglobosum LB1]GAM20527.1 hypothetical protein SAMD00019534_037020 [Acytostelium subglobosum LB1]|eukprot:XP_012760048.1 hypothetical protein SAMD00019534_037020 [Acytostelium subglobosum LB1]